MNLKVNRNLLNEAINAGVKTISEFALYLKIYTKNQYMFEKQ